MHIGIHINNIQLNIVKKQLTSRQLRIMYKAWKQALGKLHLLYH